jgi:hypothetical protein
MEWKADIESVVSSFTSERDIVHINASRAHHPYAITTPEDLKVAEETDSYGSYE